MQGFKKVLVALLVVMTILGTMGPVFAAPAASQSTSEKLSDAAVRLMALGIVKGDEKGNVNEDQPVTRAEAAAMVVRALNLEKSAELLKGTTKFADVNADPGLQWATGVINVAVEKGILRGYPDGRFDGRGNVTYAQFAKMMVYALNYGVTVEGGAWPTAVLAKADDLGLTKKLNVVADAPMTRGAVMQMIDNALTVPTLKQTGYGSTTLYEETGETLLEKLGLDEIEGRVVEIPAVAKGLDDDEVTIYVTKVNGETDPDEDDRIESNETYTQLQGVDAQGLFGLEVKAWVNDDDEIVFVQKKTTDTDIYTDTIDKVYSDGTKVDLLVLDDDVKFADPADKDKNVTIYVNNEKKTVSKYSDIADVLDEGMYGRFVEDGDEVVFAYLFDFDKSGVVTSFDGEVLKYFDKDGNDRQAKFEDYDKVTVLKSDLTTGSTEDLQEKSAVYLWENTDDDELYIVASAPKSVEGKLTRIREDEIYIDGTKYKTTAPYDKFGTAVSSNGGEDIVAYVDNNEIASEAEDLVDSEVEAWLDINGRVIYLVGASEASSGDIFAIATDAYQSGADYVLKVLNKDGEEVVYSCEEKDDWLPFNKYFDSYYSDSVSANRPYLPVKFEVNSDGEIKDGTLMVVANSQFANAFGSDWKVVGDTLKVGSLEFRLATADEDADVTLARVTEFDDDDDYIATESGKIYIEDDTVLMNLAVDGDEWDDPEVVEWANIEGDNVYASDNVYVVSYGDPEVKFVAFLKNFDTVEEDMQFGIVSAKPTYDGDDWYAQVDVAGKGVVEYKLANKGDVAKGDMIAFTVTSSNKIDVKYGYRVKTSGVTTLGDFGSYFSKDLNLSGTALSKVAQLVTEDGNYLTLTRSSNCIDYGKIKIDKDAVVYTLDDEAGLDVREDYSDIYGDEDDGDRIIPLIDSDTGTIQAVLVVNELVDVEDLEEPGEEPGNGTQPQQPTEGTATANVEVGALGFKNITVTSTTFTGAVKFGVVGSTLVKPLGGTITILNPNDTVEITLYDANGVAVAIGTLPIDKTASGITFTVTSK